MKRFFVFLGVVLTTIGSAVRAQEVDSMAPLQKSSWGDAKEIVDYIPDIVLESRFGYNQNFTGKTGRFGGDGLFLDVNGKINSHFSYSLHHRIACFEGTDGLGFDNTDWLYLTYETDKFSITAGKNAIFIGNFEYDAADMDSYWQLNSLFWNIIDPWQWGVSAAWYPADDQSISFQVCNSPFASWEISNLFAYALEWRGSWDFYESCWTTNLWQYDASGYVGSINLGNRFYLGNFTVDLEYMTRGLSLKGLFTDDITIHALPSYEWEWGRAFAKLGWERINEDTMGYDFTGSNIYYGAGLELFPIKNSKDIRIHAAWGSNNNYSGEHILQVGLKCNLSLTEAGKRLFNKCQK